MKIGVLGLGSVGAVKYADNVWHALKVVPDQQYFNLNTVCISTSP